VRSSVARGNRVVTLMMNGRVIGSGHC
jgi:hypothetical protein